MISLAEAWFYAMRGIGLGPNPCNAFPLDPRFHGEAERAEGVLRGMLMRGDIPCTYGAEGGHHPIPATAWRRGYRLSFPDSALIPTETVSGLPVLADVRVCEETLSRRIAGMHPPAALPVERKRRGKGGRRPAVDWDPEGRGGPANGLPRKFCARRS
jgi:hypothetical protein